MKLFCAIIVCSLTLFSATTGYGANLDLSRFHEVDFEALPAHASSCFGEETLPNPLSVGGLVVFDPVCLSTAFCSSPTCIPDPANADGGNISIFLTPGGTIAFPARTKVAVLDVQGIGDNPFTLRVTDARGWTYDVQGQGVLFGQTLVRLTSPRGIESVEVVSVGGTGGPLAIAAVYYR